MQTCQFGVRPYPNGGSAARYEVFDRMTGAAVATAMQRLDAEREARTRNRDASGGAAMTVHLGPAEIAALQDALHVYMAYDIAGRDRPILEDLYALFTSWRAGDE
jgi:hypothetical protein